MISPFSFLSSTTAWPQRLWIYNLMVLYKYVYYYYYKPKQTHNSAHSSVHIIATTVLHNKVESSSDYLPPQPPDIYHSSHAVY